ncbi:MAG: hypothetical protein HYW23_01590 [Candidatus Aenigmarchaeota archaeon]|nr:hypothetical protein [Candidatus Aenigmarchaeota archaeon]
MSFREYKPTIDEELTLMEGSEVDVVEILKRLKPGESYTRNYITTQDAVQRMERYVGRLRESDLDIGKGDLTFGYKMPLPEKYKGSFRQLIIFRRK